MYMEVLSDTLLLVTFSKTHVFLIIVFGLWATPAHATQEECILLYYCNYMYTLSGYYNNLGGHVFLPLM